MARRKNQTRTFRFPCPGHAARCGGRARDVEGELVYESVVCAGSFRLSEGCAGFGNHAGNAEEFPGERSARREAHLFSKRDRLGRQLSAAGTRRISGAAWLRAHGVPRRLRGEFGRETRTGCVAGNRAIAERSAHSHRHLRRRRAARVIGGTRARNETAERQHASIAGGPRLSSAPR